MKENFIPAKRKFGNTIALVMLIIVLAGGIFHFWFINNTERFFENIVSTQSKGKVKLKVKNVSFNYFSRNVRLQDAQFVSEDSLTSINSYHFDVADLRIKVKSVRSLIFNQEILIDSLALTNPHVTIRHIRHEESTANDTTNHTEEFSIAREMGRIYRSIEDGLNVLQIRYFRINEGRFTLENALTPADPPINISHIFLEIDNINVKEISSTDSAKFLFSDNIILRTHDQQINFPGGRHSLTFGSFQMNVKNKMIEIENCRITGEKSDTSKVAFDMLFRKLQLLNFNFAALANNDLIKADSVYCQEPELKLSLQLRQKNESRSGQPFQLDELLRQVGTEMDIKFAGLSDANVEITTTRGDDPVVFSSKGNDVFLYDFKIDNNAKKPIQVGGIDVAIRNYDMVTRDGSIAIKFDSIQLRNNTIRLNNFSLTPTGLVSNKSIRNIDVPRLQITGLSWEKLLVDRTMAAKKAELYNPTFSYQRSKKSGRRQSFFHTLDEINELMEVDQLEIVNGQFSLGLKNQQSFELENINFSIQSNDFISSRTIGHIESSINRFDFSKGMIRLNNLQIFMNDVVYAGTKEQLHASSVIVNDVNSQSTAQLNDVYVSRLSINEVLKKISVDSVNWTEGNIVYIPAPKEQSRNKRQSEINIRNISGKKTNITAITPSLQLKMDMDWVNAGRFSVLNSDIPVIEALTFSGKNFAAQTNNLLMQSDNYMIHDERPSTLNQLTIKSYNANDSLDITIPSLRFAPSIYSMLRNHYIFNTIEADKPVVNYHTISTQSGNDSGSMELPVISIDHLKLIQPILNFKSSTANGPREIKLNASGYANGLFQFKNISVESNEIDINEMDINANKLIIHNGKKAWGIDSGEVRLFITGTKINAINNQFDWKALLNEGYIKNPLSLQLMNDATIHLETMKVNNLNLVSQNSNLLQYLEKSPALTLSEITGKFKDTSTTVSWYNGTYDHAQRKIEIDSLHFHPLLNKNDFIDSRPYQADYLNASTGKLSLQNFNVEKLSTDSVIEIGSISADKASISVFRNKLKPRKPVLVKYLPTAALQRSDSRFNIDSVILTRSNVSYSELSDVTNDTGTIYFTDLNAYSGPYKTSDILAKDSFNINAVGYLFNEGIFKMQFQQSYMDTLGGFTLAIQSELHDATVANQILLPVTNVRISSGTLDSLWLNVTGNNYMATGKTKMLYNKLKIQVKKNPGQNSFSDRLSTFVANNFMIRSNNRKNETGIIFFERWQDRSVFNYIVKILINGISTSIGLKNNVKIIKERDLYYKNMKQ